MALVITFVALSLGAIAQKNTCVVKGKLIDKSTNKGVTFATVVFSSINRWDVTDEQGNFTIDGVIKGKHTISASCLGYKTLEQTITISRDTLLRLNIAVKTQNIEEVVVIAQEIRSNGTASVIKKDALSHLQPNSFADILELLPGGISQEKRMTGMNLIGLRIPLKAHSLYARDNQFNSSLGTSFIIDGTPLSNDAQLQDVSGAPSYLGTSEDYIHYRNTTGKGIDMRMIPTDDIEKVEVVRGIPSVRYGSLSSGLVNIVRSYKKKPLHIRTKATSSMKLLAIGKGFLVGDHTLNANIDYVDYKADPRNTLVNYGRITGSLRYSNNPKKIKKAFDVIISLDYTGSFDKSKRDAENDTKKEFYKDNYNKYRFSSQLKWNRKDDFFKDISLSLSASYTNEVKTIQRIASGGLSPILNETKSGEYYGEFLPASYLANLKVDGKPLSLFAKVNTNLFFDSYGITHNIFMGADWRFNKNYGDGEIFDIRRPLYAGNGRPRSSKDIPAMEELSFYGEDNLFVPVGRNKLRLQTGLRASTLLNVGHQYKISSRFYFDPRVNVTWQFPDAKLFNIPMKWSVRAGFGWHTRFPTLSHLYPNKLYIDAVQLNYYSQNEKLRQMHYKTKVIDPTNYNLTPNRNKKWEVGCTMQSNRIRFDITVYYEKMTGGFRNMSNYDIFNYKDYITASGPNPKDLTAPPTVDMFQYKAMKRFVLYGQKENGASEEKRGIEYQLDLGRIDAIKSRVSINGAFMQMKYGISAPRYRTSPTIIGGKDYPYVGYYTWNDSREYEQFNTNFRFDTQVKSLGLIFSSTFQVLWYTSWKYNKHNGMPDFYIDMEKNKFPYTLADTTDPLLRFLYKKPSVEQFDTWRVPITIDYNLKVTKLINESMKLAFYVNRILYYYPNYSRKDGFKVKREASPYFGMELNINI